MRKITIFLMTILSIFIMPNLSSANEYFELLDDEYAEITEFYKILKGQPTFDYLKSSNSIHFDVNRNGRPKFTINFKEPVYIETISYNTRVNFVAYIATDTEGKEYRGSLKYTDSPKTFRPKANNIVSLEFYSSVINREGSEASNFEVKGELADRTPPGEISNIVTKAISSSEIEANWVNPLDDDFTNVDIYINGEFIERLGRTTRYTFENLEQNTEYVLGFKTVDKVGNISNGIDVLARTLNIDDRPIPELLNLVSEVRDTSIKFTWDNSDDSRVVEVRIYRDGVQIGVAHTPTNYFIDFGLDPHTTYQFVFYNSDDEGNLSEGIRLTEKTKGRPIGKIKEIWGESWDGSIDLSWRPLSDPNVIGYKIYMNGEYEKSVINTNAYIDSLENNVTYTIQVSAYNQWGESELSDPILITPEQPEIPVAPRVRASSSTESITLSWDPIKFARSYRIYEVQKEGSVIESLLFERAYADEGESLVGETTATTFTIHGLEPGEELTFYVSAVNELGESPKAMIRAMTKPQLLPGEFNFGITPWEVMYNAMVLIGSLASFILLGLVFYFLPKIIQLIKQAAS